MTTIYWFCLGGGLAFSLLLVLLDGILDGAFEALDSAIDAFDIDGALDPLSFVAGLTVFGGAGLVLNEYASLGTTPEVAVSAVIGLVTALALHFVYVKPMKKSENSTAFSQAEYVGKMGEVGTSVPASGFGEVQIRMGASTTFQTASSFDGTPIPQDTPIVVVEIASDGILLVSPLTPEEHSPLAEAPRPRLQTRV